MMPADVPATQNARFVYEQAAKTLGDDKNLPKWLTDRWATVSKEDLAAFVEKQKDTLALLYKASSLPYLRYNVDLAETAYLWPLPEYSKYTKLAYLLYRAASLKADAGDAGDALKDAAVIEAMSNHFREFRTNYYSTIVDRIRVQALEYILSRRPEGSLKQPIPVKAHAPSLGFLQQTLRFEILAGMQTLSFAAIEGCPFDYGILGPPGRIFRLFFLPVDMQMLRKRISLLSEPVNSYEDLVKVYRNIPIPKTIITEIFGFEPGPNIDPLISVNMAYEARQGLADLALAMTAYKSAKGRYPEKLEELVPNYIDRIPIDPFDGKPLKMKPVKGGLELYSTASHPEIKPQADTQEPINFYLGKEAYEEFRVKPAREKRLKAEQSKKQQPDVKK